MLDHWVLVGQTPVKATLEEWVAFFEDPDNRRVFWTQLGPFCVSTIFIGLDHNFFMHGPPILFETMTFVDGDDGREFVTDEGDELFNRYATWAEAEAGHWAAVRWLAEHRCEPGEVPAEIQERLKQIT